MTLLLNGSEAEGDFVLRLTLVSISQTDLGHLMRFKQCLIPYCHCTDVHGNRTPFIRQRTE